MLIIIGIKSNFSAAIVRIVLRSVIEKFNRFKSMRYASIYIELFAIVKRGEFVNPLVVVL